MGVGVQLQKGGGMKETIARLRELEKKANNGGINGGEWSQIITALPALLDHIGELEATIAKHERREDEHCRQIEELEREPEDVKAWGRLKVLERKNTLLLAAAKDACDYQKRQWQDGDIPEHRLYTALKAAKDGGALKEDK